MTDSRRQAIEDRQDIAHRLARPARARDLDQLPWRAAVVGARYGVRLGIRANDATDLAWARHALPVGWRRVRTAADRQYSLCRQENGCPGDAPRYDLYAQARRLLSAGTRDETFRVLENDTHLHLAEYAPNHVFVHAGVVGWHGRAVIMPGRSLAGKSTLVAALLRAGADYYSDEFAVLDRLGRVHPFPRALSIRGPAPGQSQRISHTAFGAARGVQPLPVGAIVVTRYRANGRWMPRLLSPAETVLLLCNHAIGTRRRPRVTLDFLARAARDARAVSSPRGEVETVIRYLTECTGRWHDYATHAQIDGEAPDR